MTRYGACHAWHSFAVPAMTRGVARGVSFAVRLASYLQTLHVASLPAFDVDDFVQRRVDGVNVWRP